MQSVLGLPMRAVVVLLMCWIATGPWTGCFAATHLTDEVSVLSDRTVTAPVTIAPTVREVELARVSIVGTGDIEIIFADGVFGTVALHHVGLGNRTTRVRSSGGIILVITNCDADQLHVSVTDSRPGQAELLESRTTQPMSYMAIRSVAMRHSSLTLFGIVGRFGYHGSNSALQLTDVAVLNVTVTVRDSAPLLSPAKFLYLLRPVHPTTGPTDAGLRVVLRNVTFDRIDASSGGAFLDTYVLTRAYSSSAPVAGSPLFRVELTQVRVVDTSLVPGVLSCGYALHPWGDGRPVNATEQRLCANQTLQSFGSGSPGWVIEPPAWWRRTIAEVTFEPANVRLVAATVVASEWLFASGQLWMDDCILRSNDAGGGPGTIQWTLGTLNQAVAGSAEAYVRVHNTEIANGTARFQLTVPNFAHVYQLSNLTAPRTHLRVDAARGVIVGAYYGAWASVTAHVCMEVPPADVPGLGLPISRSPVRVWLERIAIAEVAEVNVTGDGWSRLDLTPGYGSVALEKVDAPVQRVTMQHVVADAPAYLEAIFFRPGAAPHRMLVSLSDSVFYSSHSRSRRRVLNVLGDAHRDDGVERFVEVRLANVTCMTPDDDRRVAFTIDRLGITGPRVNVSHAPRVLLYESSVEFVGVVVAVRQSATIAGTVAVSLTYADVRAEGGSLSIVPSMLDHANATMGEVAIVDSVATGSLLLSTRDGRHASSVRIQYARINGSLHLHSASGLPLVAQMTAVQVDTLHIEHDGSRRTAPDDENEPSTIALLHVSASNSAVVVVRNVVVNRTYPFLLNVYGAQVPAGSNLPTKWAPVYVTSRLRSS